MAHESTKKNTDHPATSLQFVPARGADVRIPLIFQHQAYGFTNLNEKKGICSQNFQLPGANISLSRVPSLQHYAKVFFGYKRSREKIVLIKFHTATY